MQTAEDLLERATNEYLIGADWGLNIQLCDLINSQPSISANVLKSLLKKIKSKRPQTQILALTLLEGLVKNCYTTLGIVGGKDFQNELMKIATKKKNEEKVRDRALEVIAIFAQSFQNRRDFPGFEKTYIELKRLPGVNFPSVEPGAIFVPPTSKVTLQPPPNPSSSSSPRPPTSSSSSQRPPAQQSEFSGNSNIAEVARSTRENCNLLTEMLQAIDPKEEDVKKNEIVQDLLANCKSSLSVIQEEIQQGGGNILEQLLTLNDDILKAIEMYEKVARGQRIQKSPTPVPSYPPVSSPPVSSPPKQQQSDPFDFLNLGSSSQPPQPQSSYPPQTSQQSAQQSDLLRLNNPPPLVKRRTQRANEPSGGSSGGSLLDLDIGSLSLNGPSSSQTPAQPQQQSNNDPFAQLATRHAQPQVQPQKVEEEDEWSLLAKRNLNAGNQSNNKTPQTSQQNSFNPFL